MAEILAVTPRLRLRTWDAADVAAFHDCLNTPAVLEFLGGVQDYGYYEGLYARSIASQRDHGHCFWIVERQSDNALLGFCGLKRTDAPEAPMQGAHEIGWRLREDAWGAGYAREAAEATLTLAFGSLAAPFVVAITCKQNSGSWGLMQRLGMYRAPELDFVDTRLPPDIAHNTIVYRIHAEDWTQ